VNAPPLSFSPERAAWHLARGGLLAFPTETSWGLAADAACPAALRALRRLKGRPAEKPLSVLVEDIAAALALGAVFSGSARALAEAFWPGPLTLVVPQGGALAAAVAGPGGALGLRCSPHPVARELARRAAAAGIGPLTATSLNASGCPPARLREEAERICRGRPGLALVEGPDAGGAPESSVVDATGAEPKLLREGALAAAEIARALQGSSRR